MFQGRCAAHPFWARSLRVRSRQQFLRIRMLRRFKNIVTGAAFDHFAVLDHYDVVGQSLDDCQIMADEQVRQPVLLLKIAQQCNHLFLYRAIQR